MKLYLSSYHFGDEPEKLKELVAKTYSGTGKPTVGIIPNAGDMHTPEDIMQRYEWDAESFIGMGFKPALVDLKLFFGENRALLPNVLNELDMVWVRGGNVFILRRAMRQSGFDELIGPLVRENKLVYAGYSAGAVMTAPSLKGIEAVDDPTELPDGFGYEPDVIWEGLSFVDYVIVPHYKSDHPEAPLVDEVVEYYDAHDITYRPLRDGEVIIVDN